MIISLDTETTGMDFAHGAMPFLVTTCDDEGTIRYWEWDVDPLTRRPFIPQGDVADIAELMDSAEQIYLQNSKFDARALLTIGLSLPWPKVRDTLVMGHLLASNHRHDLTWMCIEYLGVDIEPYELRVKEVVQACRNKAKAIHPDWKLAGEDVPGMPSVTTGSKRDEDKPWRNDMWLPRAMWREHGDSDPAWKTIHTDCAEYANADSAHTLPLGLEMERLIRERGLWKHYEHGLHLMRIACEMECYGVTTIGEYTQATICDYEQFVAEANDELHCIAAGYGHELKLASGAAINDNMREFFYGSVTQRCVRCDYVKRIKHWNGMDVKPGDVCPKCLKGTRKRAAVMSHLTTEVRKNLALPVVSGKKTGNASLDKDAMQDYLATLEGDALDFVKLLMDKRKRETDLTYMRAYQRFGVLVDGTIDYYRIHPFLNPFATNHKRWASNSPNLQNVGGQEDECSDCDGAGCSLCRGTGKKRTSVRYCFGPAPGREWWSMDYRQIENRIPPYECGEPKAIEVFEKPNSPPYWGSLYYLTASVLYADEFWPCVDFDMDHTNGFKRRWPRLYKKAKFFNLAKQYGAGRNKGDLLSGIKNSYDLVDNEFPLLAALQAKYLLDAERKGYVETLPSKAIDPTRGYPILASRTDDGRVLTTTPFNYHTSGTACECKNVALLRCSIQCHQWRNEGFDAWINLEVHDQILFDFPKGNGPETNIEKARVLRRLMEQSGEDLIPRIPTPVSMEYHPVTWAEGIAC